VYSVEILPSQFYGALIGVFITAIVTAFLLRGQTEGDEKREKSVKIFEKKQEVYHAFLEKFQKIIQDGDITVGLKKEDGTVDYSVDELKDLIFQLAFIQMHTSTENTKKVLMCIADIKETLNDFQATPDEDKHKEQEKFYSDLSTKLFEIVAILKADLYPNTEVGGIPKIEMENILKKFELYVEVKDADKYEIQTYFWNKLCSLLTEKGYNVEKQDFTHLVNEFYAKTKWCGTSLEIEDGVWLSIHLEKDTFFYGFAREKQHAEDAELEQRIRDTSSSFKSNSWWYGWKTPNKYTLDFWSFSSPDFKYLKNPRKRDNLIKDLADEIDRYVKVFKGTAK
jgi:gas vesicle protein